MARTIRSPSFLPSLHPPSSRPSVAFTLRHTTSYVISTISAPSMRLAAALAACFSGRETIAPLSARVRPSVRPSVHPTALPSLPIAGGEVELRTAVKFGPASAMSHGREEMKPFDSASVPHTEVFGSKSDRNDLLAFGGRPHPPYVRSGSSSCLAIRYGEFFPSQRSRRRTAGSESPQSRTSA